MQEPGPSNPKENPPNPQEEKFHLTKEELLFLRNLMENFEEENTESESGFSEVESDDLDESDFSQEKEQ